MFCEYYFLADVFTIEVFFAVNILDLYKFQFERILLPVVGGSKKYQSISSSMQHTSSPGNALISTKVITGSRSAPDLHVVNENRGRWLVA